jgi:hypothetical protein
VIITDRFVFLHLHKSGGSFVNEFLLRFIPSAQSFGYHLPRMLIPAASAHLPVLGFVRNPWSYYVSWYNFQAQRPLPNALFRVLSEDGRMGFAGTIRNMLELGSGNRNLGAVLEQLPQNYGNRGLNLPQFALAPIEGSGLGFYSYLYRHMFEVPGAQLSVRRSENLREELLKYLEAVGHRVTNAAYDFIRDAAARNTSSHEPYQRYYDDELRRLVAERDRSIIEQHGYEFSS